LSVATKEKPGFRRAKSSITGRGERKRNFFCQGRQKKPGKRNGITSTCEHYTEKYIIAQQKTNSFFWYEVFFKGDVMQMKEALSLYQNKISIHKKGREQEAYRLKQIGNSFLGDMCLLQIRSSDIARYRDQRLSVHNDRTGQLLSPATVRLEMALLQNLFRIAYVEWGIGVDNPVDRVRKPKPSPGRERRLLPREERLILRYCHTRNRMELRSIFILALETAMRQGEILSMSWENVNLKTGIAHLAMTKNGCKRDVPLSSNARDCLMRLCPKISGRIFEYTHSGFKSSWRQMLMTLGIHDLHFHDLRHEAISRLFELGTLDMMEVAAISGHKSLSMLKRYTHLKSQRLVKKLDAGKSRWRGHLLNKFCPYPALVSHHLITGVFTVSLPDFDNIQVQANTKSEALQLAQTLLIRLLLKALKEGGSLPVPDSYLIEGESALAQRPTSQVMTELVLVNPLDLQDL